MVFLKQIVAVSRHARCIPSAVSRSRSDLSEHYIAPRKMMAFSTLIAESCRANSWILHGTPMWGCPKVDEAVRLGVAFRERVAFRKGKENRARPGNANHDSKRVGKPAVSGGVVWQFNCVSVTLFPGCTPLQLVGLEPVGESYFGRV